jgi:hypothetical protein
MERIKQIFLSRAMLSALVILAGCARTTAPSVVEQAGSSVGTVAKSVPRVQDCGVLDAGTPSRFVCSGRVYTSYQLAKLREDEARKYGSKK